MKTVAIICEYNPFHLGHLHQIETVKKEFGSDTAIIAIMSGNFTERGDVAILDKFTRARIAVECGVSLVLELPFPFSASSAEFFAMGGVSLANALGCVDFLSFGSECGDIERLSAVAERTSAPTFISALTQISKAENVKNGHAKNVSALYEKLYGDTDLSLLSSPNNILAIEYLKALKKQNSPIRPHTVKRDGTDKDGDASFAGATFIRDLLHNEDYKRAYAHMPPIAQKAWDEARFSMTAPASLSRLSLPILSAFRLDFASKSAAGCENGMYEHLKKAARRSSDMDEFLNEAATKKYTAATLRRAALFSFFGVTPSMLRERVLYTQVLAMDAMGMRILHDIRKTAELSILTKPADLQKLPVAAKRQAETNYRADSIYALASPQARSADVFVTASPHRK